MALSELIELRLFRLPVMPFWKTLFAVLFNKNHALKIFSQPDLIVGAGHRTHSTILLLSKLFKAKSVVLMKPSLPGWLFDLCIMPEHDGVKEKNNIIVTKGVINKIRPTGKNKINQGMILIGGPSKHHGWDEKKLIEQINSIIKEMPHVNWQITNSRRTPETTNQLLGELVKDKVSYSGYETEDSEWLPEQLNESQYAWVTEDSVSMVYEALTAQCQVGILSVPQKKSSRVIKGLERIANEGFVTLYTEWLEHREFRKQKVFPVEAERCADYLNQKLLKN